MHKHTGMCVRPRPTRGGARNKSDRTSYELTFKQCQTALGAAKEALAISLPPNRFITISWEIGGISPRQAVTATGKFIKMAREWIQAQGFQTTWLWVQEYGQVVGAHSHILLHVPPELSWEFRLRPKRWVTQILGGRYVKGVLHTKRFGSGSSTCQVGSAYMAELYGYIHYMLKCSPSAFERDLGLAFSGRVQWGQRQRVIGKRLGVWQGWRKAKSDRLRLQPTSG